MWNSSGTHPLVLTGTLEDWSALSRWNKPAYLLSQTIGGRRLVPIETGRSYTDDSFGQKIMTFKEYLNTYILSSNPSNKSTEKDTAYLAQHDLLSQVSSLRLDITIPDFCHTDPPPPEPTHPLYEKHKNMPYLEDTLLNAWFGPAGTISPLHCDPYHNILAQVVGRKYIRLYAPVSFNRSGFLLLGFTWVMRLIVLRARAGSYI